MAETVRKKLRSAIASGLATITTGNGFALTLNEINEEPRSFEQIVAFPAVNIRWGREDYNNASIGGHASGFLMKRTEVELDVFLESVEDIPSERSRAVAAIDQYFGTNFFVPDTGGLPTALNAVPRQNVAWGIESSETYGGVTVPLQIDYQQNIIDPELKTQNTAAPVLTGDVNSTVAISRRENIRNAFIFQIREITIANGFNFDFFTQENIRSHEQIGDIGYPFVNVVDKTEEYFQATDVNLHNQLFNKQLHYDFDVYIDNIEDLNDSIEKALADVEKKFMTSYKIIDSDGFRTSVECMFTHNEPFGIEENRPLGGVTIGMDISYRQDIENPKTSN